MNIFPNIDESVIEDYMKEGVEIKDAMKVELSDNPTSLKKQVREAEAFTARLVYMLALVKRQIRLDKNQYILPKSREWTDLDRTTKVEAVLSDLMTVRDFFEELVEITRDRVSLGQSLLRDSRSEREAGIS